MKEVWAELGEKLTRFFLWSLAEHPGKLIGTITGFFIGLLVVLLGFWKAFVLSLFTGLGFWLGKRQDDHKNLLDWLGRFFERH